MQSCSQSKWLEVAFVQEGGETSAIRTFLYRGASEPLTAATEEFSSFRRAHVYFSTASGEPMFAPNLALPPLCRHSTNACKVQPHN